MATPNATKRFRIKPRWLLWIVCAMISIYGGTYAAFYHRGVTEAKPYNSFYFYVPMDEVFSSPDIPRRHFVLKTLYSPINGIHRDYFGGKSPCSGMLRVGSKPSEKQESQIDIEP